MWFKANNGVGSVVLKARWPLHGFFEFTNTFKIQYPNICKKSRECGLRQIMG